MRVIRVLGWLLLILLLVGAGLLTVARLLQPPGARWVQAVAFTPWAIPAYAVLLLVALVLLVRSRRRRRVPALALAMLAAAGLGMHLTWFAPQVSGANPPPAADSAPLVVVTANLAAGEVDGYQVVERAVGADADLLVLEEVTAGTLARMDRAGLGEAFGSRAVLDGEGSFWTMVLSRHELGEPTRVPGQMSALAVPVTIEDPGTGEDATLDLVAAHPAPPLQVGAWVRSHSALERWVRTHRPDLVVGDLNATADHAAMRRLAAAGYRSVTEAANEGWRPTWPSGTRLAGMLPVPPMVQVDHVLAGPELAALSSRTVPLDGGDHRALVARVATR